MSSFVLSHCFRRWLKSMNGDISIFWSSNIPVGGEGRENEIIHHHRFSEERGRERARRSLIELVDLRVVPSCRTNDFGMRIHFILGGLHHSIYLEQVSVCVCRRAMLSTLSFLRERNNNRLILIYTWLFLSTLLSDQQQQVSGKTSLLFTSIETGEVFYLHNQPMLIQSRRREAPFGTSFSSSVLIMFRPIDDRFKQIEH